jgi:hypothetical protein
VNCGQLWSALHHHLEIHKGCQETNNQEDSEMTILLRGDMAKKNKGDKPKVNIKQECFGTVDVSAVSDGSVQEQRCDRRQALVYQL